jgi:hypothetical protein
MQAGCIVGPDPIVRQAFTGGFGWCDAETPAGLNAAAAGVGATIAGCKSPPELGCEPEVAMGAELEAAEGSCSQLDAGARTGSARARTTSATVAATRRTQKGNTNKVLIGSMSSI